MRAFRPLSMTFRLKSSCTRPRLTLRLSLPLALLVAFFFLTNTGGLLTFADDVNTRYQISASAFADFYDTIPASVLGQDGLYHDVDFLFQGAYAGVTSGGLCYYPDGQSFNTSTYPMVWYSCPYPIYNESQNNAMWEVEKVILHLNLHLSSCEFARFGFCGATSSINAFYNLNYYAVDHYNYADYYINSYDNHSTIPLGFYDTNYQYPCRLYNNSGSGGLRNIAYTSEADIYITDVVLSCVDRGVADAGFVWVGFYLPFVSEDTVLEERGLPPEDPAETTTTQPPVVGSGDGSGSIVTNDSGITQFNFSWTNEFQAPGYLYSGEFSDYTDDFPATISSMMSDAESYATVAASQIADLETDLTGFWSTFDALIPARFIAAILGVSWISLFGWILTKYRG